MNNATGFTSIPPTTLADILGREQVMNIAIRPLWSSMPRVAGPAFTVRCARVVVPSTRQDQTLLAAQGKLAEEAEQSLDSWEQAHRVRISTILSQNGFEG